MTLQGDESLLDLGCGDGKVSAFLSRLLPRGRVVRIDSSEPMINLAREKFTAVQYPNLEFIHMDGTGITFETAMMWSSPMPPWIG